MNFSDSSGGAAKATLRLCKKLNENGVLSKILVCEKKTALNFVTSSNSKFINKKILLNRFVEKILKLILKISSTWSFSFIQSGLIEEINTSECDIVHLNWVGRGLLSLDEISLIKKPVVWTMHDSWVFTGGCHLPLSCNNYISGCKLCPQCGSGVGVPTRILLTKCKLWTGNITYVAPSSWLHNCAKMSLLLKNKNVKVIPNGLDMNLFKPGDKQCIRKFLGIEKEKKVILFGAVGAVTDKNKGFNLFKNALSNLNDKRNYVILVFGAEHLVVDSEFSYINLGYISDEKKLVDYYSAADVFVMPSISENLPYTVMESISCGTPVAAFNIGGISDLIDHKKNGYLAKKFDSRDLAKGIEWVIKNNKTGSLSRHALKICRKKFEINKVSKLYSKLYSTILGEKK